MNRRTGYHYGEEQPQRIDHQMTLPAFDLLACIKALCAALWRDAGGLRVNDRRAGLQRAFNPLPPLLAQSILKLFELAQHGPAGERFLHRMPRR